MSGSGVVDDFVLACKNLVVAFDGVRAVDEVSLNVSASSVTGVIGPNGAGKSTLVNALEGQVKLTGGQIWLNGVEISSKPSHARAQLGMMRTYQITSVFNRLTVLENVILGMQGHPGEKLRSIIGGRRNWMKEERIRVRQALELLEQVGLREKADEYAGTMSGGERRLVELLRAFAAQPVVLMLDEPMAGVSPALIPVIVSFIRKSAKSGMAVMLIEHELEVVEELCEEVLVMANGRLLAQGTLAEVRARPEVVNAYVAG